MKVRRRCCCRKHANCRAGYFFIAIGAGLFLAYTIPRYVLIALLGICLIGAGVCIIVKK